VPIVVLVTLSAAPVPLVMVFGLVPVVTFTVPPPVAVNPAPEVVAMSSPPFVRWIVAPVLLDRVTPALVPELIRLLAPLKVTVVPPLLPETEMPRAAALGLMSPDSVTVPPVLLWMSTASVVVFVIVPE
jgi:hypothetical protein